MLCVFSLNLYKDWIYFWKDGDIDLRLFAYNPLSVSPYSENKTACKSKNATYTACMTSVCDRGTRSMETKLIIIERVETLYFEEGPARPNVSSWRAVLIAVLFNGLAITSLYEQDRHPRTMDSCSSTHRIRKSWKR